MEDVMPLLARVVPDQVTDEEALLAPGWQVDAAESGDAATVTLSRTFTAATRSEALAAARQCVDAGGGA